MKGASNETPWGEVGYITYKRTYARDLTKGKTEEWPDTIDRIIKACDNQLFCNFSKEDEEYIRYFMTKLKGTVAGRFLWQLGTKTVDKLGLPSLQNCAFVSIDTPIRPFTWAFEMLMLGSGVGFNIQKENVYQLPKLQKKKVKIKRVDENDADFIVPDSREGWVKLLGKVLKASFYTGEGFSFATHLIRSKGSPIKGFGGTASGPEDLVEGIFSINEVLNKRAGKKLRPIDCLDIMNIIGQIVVSGNVRRSAQIAIGDFDDLEFLTAKRWDIGGIPNWRAMSNNSVVCNDISKLPTEFWEGYYGKGEPYGLINLEAARKMGRTGEYQYPDPTVQGFNPCFTGDMKLLTSAGYKTFEELENKTVNIVNVNGEVSVGSVWCSGEKPTIEVRFAGDRDSITCTKDHIFMLSNGKECKAKDLVGKRVMPSFKIKTSFNEEAFLAGFIQGDGSAGRLKSDKHLGLEVYFGEKDSDIAEMYSQFTGKWYSKQAKDIAIKYEISPDILPLRALPTSTIFYDNMDDFLSGLWSANGSVISGHRIAFKSTCKKLIDQLKNILKYNYGISSYITTNKPKKITFSNGDYVCKESYDLNISRVDDIILFTNRISFGQKYKQEALEKLIIAKAPYVSAIKDFGVHRVYDFTEPDTHWGIVEGVVVHNCAEQGLADYETCCLAEIFLPNIESKEELFKVASYLYKINKHSLNIPCAIKETETIVHQNMRMGIGVTGYLQSNKDQKEWLKDCYVHLRELDKEYSKQIGVPESVKLTTTKPSGTLSLLAGVTPGAHPGYAEYHIRRIRIASDSALVDICRKNGYDIEYVKRFDGSDDHNTVVVSFPCKFPTGTLFAKDMTAIDQLNVIKDLQANWSDNSVSVTVYYKKEELPSIKEWLNDNFDNIKTVSFLLHKDHGFAQAPLEEISKEKYEEMISKVIPIDSIDTLNLDDLDIEECEGGACPVR